MTNIMKQLYREASC